MVLPLSTFEVSVYRDGRGNSAFQRWFAALDNSVAAKVTTALLGFECGNFSDSKNLRGGIWERRIHTGPGYRVYFGIDKRRLVVLLIGGSKRTQVGDIRKARLLWYEYKTGNRQA